MDWKNKISKNQRTVIVGFGSVRVLKKKNQRTVIVGFGSVRVLVKFVNGGFDI